MALPGAPQSFTVSGDHAGKRLDHFLAGLGLPESRSQLRHAFETARIRVNGAVETKPARKLREGDSVEYVPPEPRPATVVAEAIPLEVVYEDRHLIVVNKPAGLVVHPAVGHEAGTLVNALLHHCHDLAGVGGELRPGIVHRLDKDTSGLLVASKDDPTHLGLAALFKEHRLVRRYLAIVHGQLGESGTIETLYNRHPVHRKKFSSQVTSGRPALTRWRRLELLPGATYVEVELGTGRTHQIRVHFSDLGHPVVGDRTYGRRPGPGVLREVWDTLGRQALHAATLGIEHPITKEQLLFTRPPPADFLEALSKLRAAR